MTVTVTTDCVPREIPAQVPVDFARHCHPILSPIHRAVHLFHSIHAAPSSSSMYIGQNPEVPTALDLKFASVVTRCTTTFAEIRRDEV